MDDEYYEVVLHQNQYSTTFLYSFEKIQLAEEVIKKEYPDYMKVESNDANLPFIVISNSKQLKSIPSLYYCKKKA